MLVLNERLDKLEGVLKLSDCEYEFVVRWLSGSSQASFFIGDKDEERLNVQKFINGNQYCYIDLNSFLSYLKTVEHIVKKYKSMYYGPFNHLTDIHNRFSNMAQEDAKIVLSYEYPERYIRILNNKRNFRENALVFGEGPLNNGDDFRHSYIGGITNITIQKNESGQYWLRIELVDNWRDVIMEENGKKVTLESLISIFNIEMENNIDEGMSEVQSGQVFGIKYAPLLDNNSHKFSYKDIVSGSNYNSQDVLTAVELGISISSAVIWSPDLSIKSNTVDEENVQNYENFKKLLAWFTNQLNVNNGLIEGTKTSGQGYKGGAIRELYKEWRDFEYFTLDCNIIGGFQSIFSKVNYINKTDTGINIRPKFNKETKQVEFLFIDLYEPSSTLSDDILKITDKEYTLSGLGLDDGNEPNELLKELFDDYYFVIKTLSKEEHTPKIDFDSVERLSDGENLIVYGTPGCGKSYFVQHTLLKDFNKENIFRTTFYQDYTNTDFVGQILPTISKKENGDEEITYVFNPGPFSLALKQAIDKPDEKVAIVIEELNRGNAASIFGDIFQLLDRKDGVSEYPIKNVNIMDYLNREFYGNYFFDKIKIPGNLYIYATMNTSDQNVFTLDTAFKRRWKFKKMANKFTIEHPYKDYYIPTAIKEDLGKYLWEDFVSAINKHMLEVRDSIHSEDKQIGVYFISQDSLEETQLDVSDPKKIEEFSYKLFEYLWNDVAKFNLEEWFDKDIKSLDELIDAYNKQGIKVLPRVKFDKEN